MAFCIWAALCLFLTLGALRGTTLEQYETFHIYYQPLIILVAMLWLWAGNVRYFEWRNMRYDLCFSAADQRFLLSSRQILQVGRDLRADLSNMLGADCESSCALVSLGRDVCFYQATSCLSQPGLGHAGLLCAWR